MIDIEKVIKGLEHCDSYGCKGCPYETTVDDDGCKLNKEAVEFLKELRKTGNRGLNQDENQVSGFAGDHGKAKGGMTY